MTDFVVLGAGYAGVRAIQHLQSATAPSDSITWVSDEPEHLVRHEIHRAIRDPEASDHLRVPLREIRDERTTFIEGFVSDLDVDRRTVHLADDREVTYDRLVVALGSDTAYYGIPGLERFGRPLRSLADARVIHDWAISTAGGGGDGTEPATDSAPVDRHRIVIGGAGLSGIQVAGELADLRDASDLPLEITIVEAMDHVLPAGPSALRDRLRRRLEAIEVEIRTDSPIVEVESSTVHLDDEDPLAFEQLVWTGGITGPSALEGADLEDRHNRLVAGPTFETSDPRVFAVGDAALLEIDGTHVPATAQAAWQAGTVAAANAVRASRDEPLESWRYRSKGTVVSVGDWAVASEVVGVPLETFAGPMARFLKKFVGARWIASVSSWRRASRAWPYL